MDGLIVYQIKYQFICMIIDWLITNELCVTWKLDWSTHKDEPLNITDHCHTRNNVLRTDVFYINNCLKYSY